MAHVPPLSMAARADVCAPPDTVPHPLTSFDSATRDAYLEGHDDGARLGYVDGWRWGAACGALLVALVCGVGAFAVGWLAGAR